MHKPVNKRHVAVLALAIAEAKNCMSPVQYGYAVGIAKRLCDFDVKEEIVDLPITTVGEFRELQLTDGVFGSLDVRIYFKDHSDANEVVILKTLNMEDQEVMKQYWMINIETRWDCYTEGSMTAAIVYRGHDAIGE